MLEKANTPRNSLLIVSGLAVVFSVIFIYQFFSLGKSEYELRIENQRIQKNAQFERAPYSPIKDKTKFKGLRYFPPTEFYRVNARFEANAQTDTLLLRTGNNQTRRMIRLGSLSFKLNEKAYQLSAYQEAGIPEKRFFVPFNDKTNGKSTYTGGRYLELPYTQGKEVELDFNLAYNPYCVYDETYSCPLPPAENNLDVEIMAGEMMWQAD